MARLEDTFRLVDHDLDAKFHVERAVAAGGFAIVYRATHLLLNRPIALKVLKPPPAQNKEQADLFAESFAAEARTMARINHPNIVQLLDFGVSVMPNGERAPWMALEWIEGSTLRAELIARRGKGGRTVDQAFALLRPALEALSYAHEEGVAHRDIKPANLMVVQTRRGPALKILDFGIAKILEEGEEAGSGDTATRAAMQAFSLPYAAPEQISGTRTGPWTDVHAMALILIEMLTDQPPYEGDTRSSLVGEVLNYERPTAERRGVDSGPFAPVLHRALAIKPSDRYRNASEFLHALDQAISDRSTQAVFDGPPRARAPVNPGATQTQSLPAATAVPVRQGPSPLTVFGVIGLLGLGFGVTLAVARPQRTPAQTPVVATPPPPAPPPVVIAAPTPPPPPPVVQPAVPPADAAVETPRVARVAPPRVVRPRPPATNNPPTTATPAARPGVLPID